MMNSRKFKRTTEDFICKHCGKLVKGDGYTDHCPYCLYSKHVDINPGDREEECHGLMKPIGVEVKGGNYIIYYRCLSCNYTHRVKANKNDNYELIVELSNNIIPKNII